jgi:hypothetical protein
MFDLSLAIILLSLLHAVAPKRWLYINTVGQKHEWSTRKMVLVALVASLAHTVSTAACSCVASVGFVALHTAVAEVGLSRLHSPAQVHALYCAAVGLCQLFLHRVLTLNSARPAHERVAFQSPELEQIGILLILPALSPACGLFPFLSHPLPPAAALAHPPLAPLSTLGILFAVTSGLHAVLLLLAARGRAVQQPLRWLGNDRDVQLIGLLLLAMAAARGYSIPHD